MTLKQATSDIAQVGLISEDKLKETSDIAHVKPSKLLLPGFTKAKQTQPLKTATSGFEARVITGKEARDKSGLGSAACQILTLGDHKQDTPGLISSINMDVKSKNKDGVKNEEDESVNSNGFAVGLHVSKFNLFAVAWELKQKPWL
ncbi:hypothetical protein AgCh_030658 [Apium graveolens]